MGRPPRRATVVIDAGDINTRAWWWRAVCERGRLFGKGLQKKPGRPEGEALARRERRAQMTEGGDGASRRASARLEGRRWW